MAYQTPNWQLKSITIVKDYENLRVKISTEEGLPKITLGLIPDLKVAVDESGTSDVLEGMLGRIKVHFSYEDVSKLISKNGYEDKLADSVFTLFDTGLSRSLKGDMRLLPGVKGAIRRGLVEYRSEILKKAKRLFESESPLTSNHFLKE